MKRNKIILTPVEELPKKENPGTVKHDLYTTLNNFVDSDHKIVRVDFNPSEYVSIYVANNSFAIAIKDYKLPIQTCIRNGELYLIKKDIY